MAGTINSGQDNKVSFYGEIPEGANQSSVIAEFNGQYVEDKYSAVLTVAQRGAWIVGTITEDLIPPRDDFYDVFLYAGGDGNVSWELEPRAWADIDQTWEAIEGIFRSDLIVKELVNVTGNQSFNTKEYESSSEDDTSAVYVSESEDFNQNQYISENETAKSKSY